MAYAEDQVTLNVVDNHFWHDSTGAYVTQVTQDEWNDSTDPNYHSGGNTRITSTGMAVRDGETELATFGASGAQIGQDAAAHLEITSEGLSGYGDDGAEYFDFSSSGASLPSEAAYSLGNSSGSFSATYNSRTKIGSISKSVANIGQSGDSCPITRSSAQFRNIANSLIYAGYSSASNCTVNGSGNIFEVSFDSFNVTIGTSSTHSASVRVQLNNYYMLIESAWSYSSTSKTITQNIYVTVQTSGSPTFSGRLYLYGGSLIYPATIIAPCMTFGTRPLDEVAGGMSAVLGNSLYGSSDYQTAIGKYNTQDASDTYALMIGNGTADNARSNAMTVDWSGNVEADGDITDGSNNKLSTVASTVSKKVKNVAVKYINKTVSVSAGTATSPQTTTVTFTSSELNGGTLVGATACMGSYALPYFNVSNSRYTWISEISTSSVKISNTASAWSNYDTWFVLFIQNTTS